ncbi:MAG: hypothetical protein IPH10_10390 [bacterium]|nr:hypothetical protein [bacterium]
MYAPATVEGEITVAQPNGRLTILPHPGAEDPTIRFRGAGSILVQGWDLNYPPAKMYIQGEPENRVRLEWDSTTVWVNIESRRANIYMNNADLIGKGWVNWNVEIISGGRSPVFYADSCTFVGFEDGLWIHGLIDSCTVSNCRFESMGGNADNYSGQGSGMTVVYSDGVTIENCQFEDNDTTLGHP